MMNNFIPLMVTIGQVGVPVHHVGTVEGGEGLGVAFVLTVGVVVGRLLSRKRRRTTTKQAPRPEVSSLPSTPVQVPERTHCVGAWSSVGNTRTTNQDRVCITEIAGVHVIVVADGLGGLPHGGEAAEAASSYAMELLRSDIPTALAAGHEGMRTLLLATAWRTAMHVVNEAARLAWTNEDGFRTTLIITVALPEVYVSCWVGDGAVNVVRADDRIVQLLEPHKDVCTPDMLAASLGPRMDGRPSWAICPREPGDILAVMTDGIGDVFNDALVRMMREHLVESRGSAMGAARAVVGEIEALRDEAGPIVTDNITLGLLVTEVS